MRACLRTAAGPCPWGATAVRFHNTAGESERAVSMPWTYVYITSLQYIRVAQLRAACSQCNACFYQSIYRLLAGRAEKCSVQLRYPLQQSIEELQKDIIQLQILWGRIHLTYLSTSHGKLSQVLPGFPYGKRDKQVPLQGHCPAIRCVSRTGQKDCSLESSLLVTEVTRWVA